MLLHQHHLLGLSYPFRRTIEYVKGEGYVAAS